ncbi:copper-binding protein [Imbroritus primus]|uniref:Copper-binding protein n=1 Tax=Imbroritus primus TaxID=3058603 RepID=A0ACD3SRJ9_9BURK|nr:copper-binding protein [Burkholderiaceae bacterium PBA]
MRTSRTLLGVAALAAALSFPALAAPGHGAHGAHGSHGSTSAYASAIGQPGDPAKVTRTVEITMDDTMRFTPASVEAKAGETIRFFLKNEGKVPHEMVIGTLSELQEHAEMMRKMPDMKHDDPNSATLAPGKRGGIVWQFTQAGTVDFACLIPGHFEAGMVGKVTVQ